MRTKTRNGRKKVRCNLEENLMSIRPNRIALILVMAALLLPPSIAMAQETTDWSRLNTVATGSKLLVKLKNGESFEGKLTSVSDTALSLSVKNKPVDLKRDDVFTVHQSKRKSATKATLIGMAVGAGAGAAIGAAGSGRDNSFDKLDHAVTAGLTVIGAGAGAVTGYLIGRRGTKRVLIYRSK
jgi:hypothetical protein